MKVYDVGIGWANPVDEKFVEELKPVLRKEGLSYFEITYHNLTSVFEKIVQEVLHFHIFSYQNYFVLAAREW
jgi:hypothetical protein